MGRLFVAGFLRAARSSARDSALIALGEGYHSVPFDHRSSPRWWHHDPWLLWTLSRPG